MPTPRDFGHPLNLLPGADISEIGLDPYLRLASAMLIQAIKDLKAKNIFVSLSAWLFWIDPDCGSAWLQALGFREGDPDLVFMKILEAANERHARAG